MSKKIKSIKDALRLYKPPFEFSHGYIFDAGGNMVADQGGASGMEGSMVMQIRGWGNLIGGGGLNLDADFAGELQDEIGRLCAVALTEYWEKNA